MVELLRKLKQRNDHWTSSQNIRQINHVFVAMQKFFREQSLVSTVADFVNDVIPHHYQAGQSASSATPARRDNASGCERVEWVAFLDSDLNGNEKPQWQFKTYHNTQILTWNELTV